MGVVGIDRRGDLHHFQTRPALLLTQSQACPVLVQIGSKMNQE